MNWIKLCKRLSRLTSFSNPKITTGVEYLTIFDVKPCSVLRLSSQLLHCDLRVSDSRRNITLVMQTIYHCNTTSKTFESFYIYRLRRIDNKTISPKLFQTTLICYRKISECLWNGMDNLTIITATVISRGKKQHGAQ